MTSGTVKWFSAEKGIGFITPNNGGEELFVHHSEILDAVDARFLRQGEAVEFEIEKDLLGPNAVNVVRFHQQTVLSGN